MLGEPSPVRWDNSDLDDLLDMGQKEVAAITFGYQKRVQFTSADASVALLNGTREYSFTGVVAAGGLGLTDVISVLHVYLGNNSLPKWHPDMISNTDHRITGGGTPSYWYEFANFLGILPYPDTTFLSTTWTIEIVYAAYPSEWTTGASVLPSGFDELPTYFALYRALIAKKRWADAGAAFRQYISLARQYRTISLSRISETRDELQQATVNERMDEPTMRRLSIVR